MTLTYGRPLEVSPTDALLTEVHWTAGHVAWLRQQVQALEPAALTWGVTEETRYGAVIGGGDPSEATTPALDDVAVTTDTRRRETRSRAGLHVWLQLYQAERKHLVEVSAAAIRCGIEERRVKLAESQGALIADLIRRMLDDPAFGLTAEQRELGRRIASNHLRSLSGVAA